MQEVLTIIVTYNGMQWIERCIRSVYASIGVDPAVIVVDNASTDGTPELIEKKFPAVKLVKCAENQGFAKANNIGLHYALEYGFDYVYLLNQDAWLFPETMSTLLRAFEGYIDVNGKLLKPGILSPMQMDASLTRMDKQFRKHLAKHLELSHAEVVPVPFVMAAHWMVSADCIKKSGAFSPEFPHYGEDNNYIQRAKYHGFCTAVVKTAVAVHDRAGRKRPKDYRMNLKCISSRVRIADPNRRPFGGLLSQTIWLAAMGVLHFSTIPFRGISSLYADYDRLVESRKASRRPGAFLEGYCPTSKSAE